MSNQETLRQRVLDQLGREPGLETNGIAVAVNDDVVALTGVVTTYAQKVAAERAAMRADAHGVVNDLDVKLRVQHQRDDEAIAAAALHALRWNVRLDPERVAVRVADGWVRLEGSVDDPYQRSAAEEGVQNLVGVVGVTNLIIPASH